MAEKLCELRKKGGGGGAKQEETVLWTNPSPTSAFASQTVTLSDDINNYDYLAINYKDSTSSSAITRFVVSVPDFKLSINVPSTSHNICILGGQASSKSLGRMVFYTSDTGVNITLAFRLNSSENASNLIIPTSIIGIKNMGGYASLKDYAFMFATSDGTRSVNRGYTSNSNVFTVAETDGSSATNTITVLEACNYEYMAETGNRSTANCYVKIGDVTVSVGTTTSAAGNIYIPANTVCTVYTAPASSSINTATLTLIKK